MSCDASGLVNAAPRTDIAMVVFDIDGTLIRHPSGRVVWEELNRAFGVPAAIAAQRFADHRAGTLTYAQWVDLDIGDWQRAGASRTDLLRALDDFQLVPGARTTLDGLVDRGYLLAAVSGSLDILLEAVFPDHPFAPVFTNRIFFADDGRIQDWQATPFDFDGKARALELLAERANLPLSAIAFVGDDVNDLGAARAAGLAVAHNPRSPELSAVCDLVLPNGHLPEILRVLPPRGPR